jgi:hypothetical protein
VLRLHRILIAVPFLVAVSAASSSARADQLATEPPPPSPIYNGEQAGTCEFPTAVSLGSCTATLVHPELIIYAAHCGSNYGSVFFGNDTDGQGFSVGTEWCEVNPGWQGIGYGVDIAYCKLSEAVTEVPFTPPLMGCEVDVLQPGREVWIVGFGETDTGVYGVKHKALTTFNYTDSNGDANIGGNGVTVCFGDSGGPTYVKLEEADGFDGSWRAFGIASYVYTPCGTDGFSALMHNGVEWVESASGVDVTPCHDADGTWNPSDRCTGFPAGIDSGAGSWAAGCAPGPTVGWGATCGEPFMGGGDDGGDPGDGGSDGGTPGAPNVRITSPADGATIEVDAGSNDASVRVEIDATDDGTIVEVALVVDGDEVASLAAPPYEIEIDLGIGTHVIEALAIDDTDASGHSAAIEIEVVADGATPGGDDGNGGEDDGDGGDGNADGDDDDGDGGGGGAAGPQALPPGFGLNTEGGGCGCTADDRASGVWALVLLALARRGRRGAHVRRDPRR